MKIIELTQGKHAIVDDDDYERLSKYKWCATKRGRNYYAMRGHYLGKINNKYKNKTVYMHREVLNTDQPIDHANNNGLDNRKSNLRPTNASLNKLNVWQPMETNKSGYLGVHFYKRSHKWKAAIQVNRKTHIIGIFNSKEAASSAYLAYKSNLLGSVKGA